MYTGGTYVHECVVHTCTCHVHIHVVCVRVVCIYVFTVYGTVVDTSTAVPLYILDYSFGSGHLASRKRIEAPEHCTINLIL